MIFQSLSLTSFAWLGTLPAGFQAVFQIFLHPSDAAGKSAGKPFLLSAASCLRKNGSAGRQSRPCGINVRDFLRLRRFGQLRNSRVLQLCFARSFAQHASGSLYRPLGALASAPYQPEITCPFAAAALRRDNGLRGRFFRHRITAHQSAHHSESIVGAPQAKRGAPAVSPGIEDPFINRHIIPIRTGTAKPHPSRPAAVPPSPKGKARAGSERCAD